MKRCLCGTILTRSNPARMCGVCESAESQFRNFGERTPLLLARARQASYCFAHPEDFDSPAEWGAELDARWLSLCELQGIPTPGDLPAYWPHLEPLVGVRAIVGEVSQNGSEKVLAP